jgi:hypothetical protein
MDRELNLPLTARESALVKTALIRLRDEEKRYSNMILLDNKSLAECITDVTNIGRILDKIERMGEWDTSAKST